MIAEVAPAKVNLYLHVGPRRRDGLHAIESVFMFADIGDIVAAESDGKLSLVVVGPFADALNAEPADDNLVLRAARLLQSVIGVRAGARLTLDKRLPVAAGIGGGSADAAAALRALVRLWRLDVSPAELRRLAFSLGADVPACLDKKPARVSGAGEIVGPGPTLPPLWVCLANPHVAMPTAPVFRAFDAANPRPPPPARAAESGHGYRKVTDLMENSRNDLEPIAIRRRSVIQTGLTRLAARPGSLGARMSGSGATVFGLFSSAAAARRAAQEMAGRGWWSISARICGVDRRPPEVVC